MVNAEEKDRPKELQDRPAGVTITADNLGDLDFETNGGYKCFTADEYKTIANIIIDYRWFWFYAAKQDLVIEKYQLEIGKYQSQVALWQTMTQKQESSLKFTQNLITEQNGIKQKQNMGMKVTMYGAIGLAILEAVVIGALAFK